MNRYPFFLVVFCIAMSGVLCFAGEQLDYVIGDRMSEGCITTDDPKGVILKSVIIQATAEKAHCVKVKANYTLKNGYDNSCNINLQLPFHKIPEDLLIVSNGTKIDYEKKQYKCSIYGYSMKPSEKALSHLREFVKIFDQKKDLVYQIKSASFKCDIPQHSEQTLEVSYSRDITFYNYSKLTERVENQENWKYSPTGAWYSNYISKTYPSALKPLIEALYSDSQGLQYYYGYIFETALVWGHPIQDVRFSFSIDPALVKNILSKETFAHYIVYGSVKAENSAALWYLFDENTERKIDILEGKRNNEQSHTFQFVKRNWIPVSNPGVSYLALQTPDEKVLTMMPQRDYLERLNKMDFVKLEELSSLFESTYPFFPVSLNTKEIYGATDTNSVLLAKDLIVKHGDISREYLKKVIQQSSDKKRSLYAWTLLARIGYQDDVQGFDEMYENFTPSLKMDFVTWFTFLNHWELTTGGDYRTCDYSSLLHIRTVPEALRKKIYLQTMQDENPEIRVGILDKANNSHWRCSFLDRLSALKHGSSEERRLASDFIKRRYKFEVPEILLIEKSCSSKEKMEWIDLMNLSPEKDLWACQYFGDELLDEIERLITRNDSKKSVWAAKILAKMHSRKSYYLKMKLINDSAISDTIRAIFVEIIEFPLDEYETLKNTFVELLQSQDIIAIAAADRMKSLYAYHDPDIHEFISMFQKHSSYQVRLSATSIEKQQAANSKHLQAELEHHKYYQLNDKGIKPQDFIEGRPVRRRRVEKTDKSINNKFWLPLLNEKMIEGQLLAIENLTEMDIRTHRNSCEKILANGSYLVRCAMIRKTLKGKYPDKLEFLLPFILKEDNLFCLEAVKEGIFESFNPDEQLQYSISVRDILPLLHSDSVVKNDLYWYYLVFCYDKDAIQKVQAKFIDLDDFKSMEWKLLYRYCKKYCPDMLNSYSLELLHQAFSLYPDLSQHARFYEHYYSKEEKKILKELMEMMIAHHGFDGVTFACDIHLNRYLGNHYYSCLMYADKQYYPYILSRIQNPVFVDAYAYFVLRGYFEGQECLDDLERYLVYPYVGMHAGLAIGNLMGFKSCYRVEICLKYLELYHQGELRNEE